jgi:hypothetical protein
LSRARPGRYAAIPPDGSVLFLIGMRLNKLWKPHRWGPVMMAMPRMLSELDARPELGLAGHQIFVSGRTILVVQYWRSVEQLNAYARARDLEHLPAWRAFNKRVGTNGDVGIFHETIVMNRDGVETIYGNMPEAMLGAAFGTVEIARVGQSAARRMDATVPDDPAVPVPH